MKGVPAALEGTHCSKQGYLYDTEGKREDLYHLVSESNGLEKKT